MTERTYDHFRNLSVFSKEDFALAWEIFADRNFIYTGKSLIEAATGEQNPDKGVSKRHHSILDREVVFDADQLHNGMRHASIVRELEQTFMVMGEYSTELKELYDATYSAFQLANQDAVEHETDKNGKHVRSYEYCRERAVPAVENLFEAYSANLSKFDEWKETYADFLMAQDKEWAEKDAAQAREAERERRKYEGPIFKQFFYRLFG